MLADPVGSIRHWSDQAEHPAEKITTLNSEAGNGAPADQAAPPEPTITQAERDAWDFNLDEPPAEQIKPLPPGWRMMRNFLVVAIVAAAGAAVYGFAVLHNLDDTASLLKSDTPLETLRAAVDHLHSLMPDADLGDNLSIATMVLFAVSLFVWLGVSGRLLRRSGCVQDYRLTWNWSMWCGAMLFAFSTWLNVAEYTVPQTSATPDPTPTNRLFRIDPVEQAQRVQEQRLDQLRHHIEVAEVRCVVRVLAMVFILIGVALLSSRIRLAVHDPARRQQAALPRPVEFDVRLPQPEDDEIWGWDPDPSPSAALPRSKYPPASRPAPPGPTFPVGQDPIPAETSTRCASSQIDDTSIDPAH